MPGMKFGWVARMPGETSWDDEAMYDRWGKGVMLQAVKDAIPEGAKLRSEVPDPSWVRNLKGVWQPCGEQTLGARAAWVWWAE